MALQVLFFVPHNLVNPDDSFREIANKLLVSPVLRVLVYPKAVEEVTPPFLRILKLIFFCCVQTSSMTASIHGER